MLPKHNSVTDHIAGNTIIRYTDLDPALLEVDAVVEEQDTNLLLGKSPVIMETVESLPALLRRMEQQIEETPGNVIVRHSTPKRFIAIVYDIDQSPICLEAWVEQALITILQYCEKYRIRTLAMPLLGTHYETLSRETLMNILQNLLIQKRPAYPRHILIYQIE
ncbi:MAG: hypothetical protein U5P41_15640 [Gammaproteobacteria bacterium]|nr:hypothetical protein [Gammaproteobacteria bacterium]